MPFIRIAVCGSTRAAGGQQAHDRAGAPPASRGGRCAVREARTRRQVGDDTRRRAVGWMGRLLRGHRAEPVRGGRTCWLGILCSEGRYRRKATDDFNKRAAEPDAAQITFVFLTSRRCLNRRYLRLRGLIEAIVLTPQDGQLRIELRGNLAAMLAAAQKTKRSPEMGDLFVPIQLVAGARNQHYLQLWRPAA